VPENKPRPLPKPFGTYFYEFPDKQWLIGILNSEKGWSLVIKNPGKEVVRLCEFYPNKGDTTERMELELKDLGFSKKEIASLKNTDSMYEYRTFPVIKICSKGSKWGWQCGDNRGVEKTKKLALEKASEHRKD